MKAVMIFVLVLCTCLSALCQMTQVQLQQAINNAGATGACVVIPANNTVDISSSVIVNYSNACIQGAAPTSALRMSGPAAFNALSIAAAPMIGPEPLAATTFETQLGVLLTTGGVARLGLQVGDYVHIGDTLPGTTNVNQPNHEITRVASISGDLLTLQDPAYETFDPANGARLWKMPALSNIRISNLQIIANTANPPAAGSTGIAGVQTVDSDFSGITGNGVPGPVVGLWYGHNNKVHEITAIKSGNGASDITFAWQTGLQVFDVSSQMSTSFGPTFYFSNGGTAGSVVVTNANGAGFYLLKSSHNVFSDLQVNNSGWVGLALADNCRNNMFTDLQALTAGQTSIWINDANNDGNMLINVRARAGGIQIYAPSTGTIFTNADYDSLYDGGTGTVFK
jgi:hypothetical protein